MINEENIVANVEMTGAETNENPTQSVDTPTVVGENSAQPTSQEIAFAYLKENGIEATSIEDLKRVPEKVIEKIEVNPYEDILDDDDKAYLNYKKETGRSRKDYEAVSSNLDELPRLELARERVRRETGQNLSDESIDEYLSSELNIDLEDMSASDQIKLASFTKSILDERKAEQEKYRKPVDKKTTEADSEYVELDDKSVMRKSDYEALIQKQEENKIARLARIETAKTAVNSVTTATFKIQIDDKGTVKDQDYSYDYSEQDKHSMVSNVSDLDGVIASEYGSENSFDYKQFGEDMFWRNKNNREKAIASIIHKAIAGNTEEVLKQRGNVNFTPNEPLQQQIKEGVKMVSFGDILKNI